MYSDKIAEQTAIISLASAEIQGIVRDMSASYPQKAEEIREACNNLYEQNRKIISLIQN
jgi:hypothetical protein